MFHSQIELTMQPPRKNKTSNKNAVEWTRSKRAQFHCEKFSFFAFWFSRNNNWRFRCHFSHHFIYHALAVRHKDILSIVWKCFDFQAFCYFIVLPKPAFSPFSFALFYSINKSINDFTDVQWKHIAYLRKSSHSANRSSMWWNKLNLHNSINFYEFTTPMSTPWCDDVIHHKNQKEFLISTDWIVEKWKRLAKCMDEYTSA